MFLVYLAGPISGMSLEECTRWRDYVKTSLPWPDIQTLSPLRGKQYLQDVGKIEGSYEEWPLSSQRGIYARDRFDCTRADVVFVNLLGATERVSIGTVMEIAWAADNDVPVVLVIEREGNIHNHPMIKEACPFVVHDLDTGVDVLRALLQPEK